MMSKLYVKDEEEFEEDETRQNTGRQNFRELEEKKKQSPNH